MEQKCWWENKVGIFVHLLRSAQAVSTHFVCAIERDAHHGIRSQRGHSYIITATFVCHARISDCDIQTVLSVFFLLFSDLFFQCQNILAWVVHHIRRPSNGQLLIQPVPSGLALRLLHNFLLGRDVAG